jgi:hypothetical protein
MALTTCGTSPAAVAWNSDKSISYKTSAGVWSHSTSGRKDNEGDDRCYPMSGKENLDSVTYRIAVQWIPEILPFVLRVA